MKSLFIMIFTIISIGLGSLTYAGCNGCGDDNFCSYSDSPCDCTDPGWKWNTCMTKSDYCYVFGNDGALDEP
jgi:hypothetical protein